MSFDLIKLIGTYISMSELADSRERVCCYKYRSGLQHIFRCRCCHVLFCFVLLVCLFVCFCLFVWLVCWLMISISFSLDVCGCGCLKITKQQQQTHFVLFLFTFSFFLFFFVGTVRMSLFELIVYERQREREWNEFQTIHLSQFILHVVHTYARTKELFFFFFFFFFL